MLFQTIPENINNVRTVDNSGEEDLEVIIDSFDKNGQETPVKAH